jgi:AcrR family transcriptional regulator
MEQIAEAAGVARTTIHRRFASRQALVEALASSAALRLARAVEDGRPDTAPPLVAMHRITANVLEVKSAWAFALELPADPDGEAAALHQDIARRCVAVLKRAQDDGLIAADADLDWVRRVYYALLRESLHGNADGGGADGADPDTLATRIIDTLLHGAGPRV